MNATLLTTYAKAVAAGIVTACVAAIPFVDDGLTVAEILQIVVAAFVGTGLVAAVPNAGVIPLRDVAARRTADGDVVAGPAIPIRDGAPVSLQAMDEPDLMDC